MPVWATAAWDDWLLVSWTVARTCDCPSSVTAFDTNTGCSTSGSETDVRSKNPITGYVTATRGRSNAPRTRVRFAFTAASSITETIRAELVVAGPTVTTSPRFRSTCRSPAFETAP